MSKKDPTDEPLARKIWLAGIGAYGRALTDAAENVARVSQDTAKKFEELAQRGADIEAKTGEMISERVKLFDRPPIEERLAQFRTAFGLPQKGGREDDEALDSEGTEGADPGTDDETVEKLEARVKELEAQLEALAAKLEEDS